jgi:hypothetical protein
MLKSLHTINHGRKSYRKNLRIECIIYYCCIIQFSCSFSLVDSLKFRHANGKVLGL